MCSIADVCALALNEVLDAMLQSKKLQTELATEIKSNPDLQQLLSKVVCSQDDSMVDAESRDADPEWFEGLCPLSYCLYFKLNIFLVKLSSVSSMCWRPIPLSYGLFIPCMPLTQNIVKPRIGRCFPYNLWTSFESYFKVTTDEENGCVMFKFYVYCPAVCHLKKLCI